ncbi:hypothetical protein BDF14DRAFT_1844959 [Spinellus fusiger]|nr:hypothetical protein BDF14DRAFT_1844959 [Spinellus fusiger]
MMRFNKSSLNHTHPTIPSLQGRSLTTFIKKLWFIMNDMSIDHLITWSDNGLVICVPNATTFAKFVLPRYFKHNNWPSFVRQLNLYGFRKVYHVDISPEAPQQTIWQFKHEFFRKDSSDLLQHIRRRAPLPSLEGSDSKYKMISPHMDKLSERLKDIQQALHLTEKKCEDMQKEAIELRNIQQRQQEIIDKMLTKGCTMPYSPETDTISCQLISTTENKDTIKNSPSDKASIAASSKTTPTNAPSTTTIFYHHSYNNEPYLNGHHRSDSNSKEKILTLLPSFSSLICDATADSLSHYSTFQHYPPHYSHPPHLRQLGPLRAISGSEE